MALQGSQVKAEDLQGAAAAVAQGVRRCSCLTCSDCACDSPLWWVLVLAQMSEWPCAASVEKPSARDMIWLLYPLAILMRAQTVRNMQTAVRASLPEKWCLTKSLDCALHLQGMQYRCSCLHACRRGTEPVTCWRCTEARCALTPPQKGRLLGASWRCSCAASPLERTPSTTVR